MEMKNILQSLAAKVAASDNKQEAYKKAAEELCSAGWFNYLPSNKQIDKLLKL